MCFKNPTFDNINIPFSLHMHPNYRRVKKMLKKRKFLGK
jgi:hypothetical protein